MFSLGWWFLWNIILPRIWEFIPWWLISAKIAEGEPAGLLVEGFELGGTIIFGPCRASKWRVASSINMQAKTVRTATGCNCRASRDSLGRYGDTGEHGSGSTSCSSSLWQSLDLEFQFGCCSSCLKIACPSKVMFSFVLAVATGGAYLGAWVDPLSNAMFLRENLRKGWAPVDRAVYIRELLRWIDYYGTKGRFSGGRGMGRPGLGPVLHHAHYRDRFYPRPPTYNTLHLCSPRRGCGPQFLRRNRVEEQTKVRGCREARLSPPATLPPPTERSIGSLINVNDRPLGYR